MKVALTVWQNRISPVFDSARMLLIADVENEEVTGTCYKLFHSELPHCRAAELFDLQVKVLICGAISQIFVNMIEAHEIKIFPFITGEVNQVIDAYLKGLLSAPNFQMPGCGTSRRRQ